MASMIGFGRRGSIKARVLLIALAPVLAVLLFGAGLSGYLVYQGRETLDYAADRRAGMNTLSTYVVAMQEERRLTMSVLGGDLGETPTLKEQRKVVDTKLAEVYDYARSLAEDHTAALDKVVAATQKVIDSLPGIRSGVDTGKLRPLEAYQTYNRILDLVGIGSEQIAKTAGEAEVAFEQVVSGQVFFFVETLSRVHALALYADGSNDRTAIRVLAGELGGYHSPPTQMLANLSEAERARFVALTKSPEWARLVKGDRAVLASASFDSAGWQEAARSVIKDVAGIYLAQRDRAINLADDRGQQSLLLSLVAGVVVALVSLLAAFAAFRAATRLIRRFSELREQTLDLAERDLPAVVARAGAGESVDPERDVAWLDVDDDELGQVADAFNKAQRTAISAAVTEAETRRGVRAVFLNIAHRSQVMVHRQLEELDQFERSEDNPDQLNRLFRLDHLATRARRNAENLIILSGEQVGRQWRSPVSLRDVVRGAVSEAEDYSRVSTLTLPDVLLDGAVVADVGHLLAELVDNGTSFSPPESRVEVRGNVVGKGVVIEVEDQGLGMQPEQVEELNRMLRKPPDFSLMALAGEPRIGLFVVARLAAKHGVRVTLRESAYGGIRAILLLPSDLIAKTAAPEQPEPIVEPAPVAAPAEREPAGGPAQWEPAEPRTTVIWGTNGFRPVAPDGSDGRPALPRRVRQNNLAPQLVEAPKQQAPAGSELQDEIAERSRSALVAFQRGSQRARAEFAGAGPATKAGG